MDNTRGYTEVNLAPEQPDPTDDEIYYAEHYERDDTDGLDPNVSVVHQVDTRTVSGSDQTHAAVTDLISREIDAAFSEGREPSLDGILSRFRSTLREPARALLPPPDDDGKFSVDVIGAALELAASFRELETRVRPGRKRHGKEVREVITVRIEPRLLEALKILGLGLQNVADGLAALVDDYNRNDHDATRTIEFLGAMFAPNMRSKSLAVRVQPAGIAQWRSDRQSDLVARRRRDAGASEGALTSPRARGIKRPKGPPGNRNTK